MTDQLVEKIICQFIEILNDITKSCKIKIQIRCLKLISKEYFDDLVIEVYYQNTIKDITDILLPTPLIKIFYTNIKEKDLNSQNWINYLEKEAFELITKIYKNKYILPPIFHRKSESSCSDSISSDSE